MSKSIQITVFGAANADITGFSKEKLIYKDANIGRMTISAGGVGRNIAENLKLLGFNVNFSGVFGDDPFSRFLIDDCQQKQINISESLFLKNQSAATFLAVMDEHHDLAVGISAMQLYDELDKALFVNNLKNNLKTGYIVLETNFKADILSGIVEKYQGAKFILDTVSGKKSLRALPILEHLYILKTNLLEAQILSDIQITGKTGLSTLVRFFLNKGVQKVFITLGKDGVIFGDEHQIVHKKSIPSQVYNTIGAGDAFLSGLVYADAKDLDINLMADYGMAAAALTVGSNAAVSPKMSPEQLKNILNNA